MATSGKAAWDKHFKSSGNPKTVVNKDSSVYDVETGKKITNFTIKKGEKITFINEGQYLTKSLIEFKGKTYRISFGNISKPGSVGRVDLKPQAFKVLDRDYTFDNYYKLILESIEERRDLSGELRLYLTELVKNAASSNPQQSINDIKKYYSSSLPVSEINKDFGEVLGPLKIISSDLLRNSGIKLVKSKCKIYVPTRPNEPLLDYVIKCDGKNYKISAKSGAVTNTVKPGPILDLLKINRKADMKWKNTKQYKILELLDRYPTISGPAYAAAWLYTQSPKKYKMFSGITEMGAKSLSKSGYDLKHFSNYIIESDLAKLGKPTPTQLAYSIETKLVELSKKDIDFTEIFRTAILGQVIYVRFELSNSGTPKYSVMTSSDFEVKNVVLRTKNSNNRSADKIGVQP